MSLFGVDGNIAEPTEGNDILTLVGNNETVDLLGRNDSLIVMGSGNTDVDHDGNLSFAINPETAAITVNDSGDLVFASQNSFNLVVRASDSFAATADKEVLIQLNDPVSPSPLQIGKNLFGGQGDNILNLLEIDSNDQSFDVFGGSGNDTLIAKGAVAASGGDRLFGGLDNDTLDGSQGTGNNFLFGGQGDDVLIAGQGDLLVGGSGNDIFKNDLR